MEETIYKDDLHKTAELAAKKATLALQKLISPDARFIVAGIEKFDEPEETDAKKLVERCIKYYKDGKAIILAPIKIYNDDGSKKDSGAILMFMDKEDMNKLGALILSNMTTDDKKFSASMHESVITEALNIIGNAYIDVIAKVYKLTIMSMVPEVVNALKFDDFVGKMARKSKEMMYVVFDTELMVTRHVVRIPLLLAVSLEGKNIFLTVVAVLILGVGFWYILSKPKSEPAYSGPIDKLVIGAETSLLTSAVWVAKEKEYFDEYGLDVEIREFDSGKASFNNMLEGGVNISTVAPTPIMFQSFNRNDFSIFATFVYSDDDVKVIARKDFGISTASDLIGKKVGIVDGSTSQFFLSAFLARKGLKDIDVESVSFAPGDLPTAISTGEIDAIVVWEPHAYTATQLLGDNAIRLPSSDVYRETFNLMVMDSFRQNNPEVLKRFVKAIDKATMFIDDNTLRSQILVAERLKINHEDLSALWDDFIFAMSLDQSLIVTLENEAIWAIKNNLTDATEVPNYLDYIYFDALEAVSPEAVTIVR
jgi:ABC-type nitrate/sulfonate/bicarbonate transport system substrate-binding protein